MKKLTFLIAILLVCSYARAQRKIEYGFAIGGGLAIQHYDNTNVLSNNSIRTFNANVIVSFPILTDYYLRTSFGIANKGTVITEDALTTTNKITYYELPVHIMRKFNVPTLGKIIGGIGGYYAMGASGSLNYETPNSNTSDHIAFGNSNDFKQADYGLSVITGLQLNNNLTFNLGYDFGLYNIASQTLKDTNTLGVYNREFTVSLGFMF